MYGKTNEQYLSELQEGGRIHNLLDTPYPDLFILFETRNEDNSYRDEDDGDWVHSTNSVISREAFIKKEGEKYSFLIDYWFDEIDNFSSGLYAKVRLGQFYNLINPLGDFLFSNWYGKIEFHGNNLIYCYEPQRTDGVCSVYNRRGRLLLEGVKDKGFIEGKSVITKDGLYNYINEDGHLLMDEWLQDAQSFKNGLAFVKTSQGWGVINDEGVFIYSSQFSSIEDAGIDDYSYDCRPIAIVEDDTGQNILMRKNDQLSLGLSENVDSIFTFSHRANVILVRNNECWSINKWNEQMHQYELSAELGDFVFVDKGSVFGKHKDYSIIKKDDLYNVISAADGILFEEWFSEIIKIGGLFQVKRVANQSDKEEEKNDSKENLVLEYNLALPDGTFALEEWSRNMIITPFQNAFLVNLKPLVQKSPNGKINDNNITYFSSGYGHNCYEPIQKIQGSCNIITDRLLFNTWFDSINFLKSKVFSDDGFVKVFKDGKCNLINEKGDYVSSEWFDDIIAVNNNRIFSDDGYVKVLKDGKCSLINEKGDYYSSEWFDDVLIGSGINSIIPRAIHVKKEGKENYLLGGELVFSQWFTSISPLRGDYYSPNEAYEVSDGKSKGIYFLGKGLFCGRLYDGIRRISEDLFLCHYEKTGHIVSLDGELLLTASIENVYPFSNGFAVVTKDNSRHFNFINQKGIIVSPVWFDFNAAHRGSDTVNKYYNNISLRSYTLVCKNEQYNIINRDKQLLFKSWYDDIRSESGGHVFEEDISSERFIVYNEKRGWNLIDNKGNILCQEWYKKIYSLPQFDKGVLVVESERGRNILGKDNKLTLPNWTDGEICKDFKNPYNAEIRESKLAFIKKSHDEYYYLDRTGHFVSPYWSRDSDLIEELYCQIGDKKECLLNITLRDDNYATMHILCHNDGTPFFKNYTESVFGSIKQYSGPNNEQLLLVNKHWPVVDDRNYHERFFVIMDYDRKELSQGYTDIEDYHDGIAIVQRHGLFNFLNKDFRPISQLWFDQLGFEYYSRETEYDKYYDEDTDSVEYHPYDVDVHHRDTSFHNGYIKVESKGTFNYMDQSGRFLFPIWYDSIQTLSRGYYKVELNGCFNIIDSSNTASSDVWFDKIFKCKFDYYNDVTIYGCKKSGQYKLLFITDSGITISEAWVDALFKYDKWRGYYPVRLNGKMNFVTEKGELLLPEWYSELLWFWGYHDYDDDYVVVKEIDPEYGPRYNIFSVLRLKFISDRWFDMVIKQPKEKLFNDGWCGVGINGKFTFVNEDGELANGLYDEIREFLHGFAGVVLDGKKNYLSSEGTLLTDMWLEEISAFTSSGKAVVKIDGKLNIIDSTGTLLLPEEVASLITTVEDVSDNYCEISIPNVDGNVVNKYYHYEESRLFDNYGDMWKKDEKPVTAAAPAKEEKKEAQIEWNLIIEGIKYTEIYFGNKANLIDKTGALLFEEWRDLSSIHMCQGIPLVKDSDNKWTIFD